MRILFIDDETRRMASVVDEFESSQHEVVFRDNVDDALRCIRDPTERFDLIVMDISMPSGLEFFKEDTDGGARTGFLLYEAIRQYATNQKVVVFTNVSDPRVVERFAREDQRLCRFIRKPDLLPFQFVEEMESFVRTPAGPSRIV